jgi:E3 ubiquitin-protein ligase RNF1/2
MRECPQCRIHIPSRRCLRPDVNFDNLIKSIYGDIEQLEKYEEQEVAKVNKKRNMHNAYAESRKRGVLQQTMQKVRERLDLFLQ